MSLRPSVTRALRIVVLAAIAIGALMGTARPQNVFEQLVMPGPIIEGHAKLEKECRNCHEPFSRKYQIRLCLDCHKDIALDRTSRKGFHGRHADAATRECTYCHTDHKGRNADIIQLDRETFNHNFTNFELRDAHKTVPCTGCHAPAVAFRKAPGTCFDCHKSVDPHQGRLGTKCDTCHTEKTWRQVKAFNHDTTNFPLKGAHQSVACSACHIGERYKDIGRECVNCHQIQDVHAGRYGTKCETCHEPLKWKTTHFDHDKTDYPLRGAHVKVKCDACHTGDLYHDRLRTTCVSCHKKDDRHEGKLGTRCEQCHSEASWRRTTFDHDVTRFPLIGHHAVVPCEECHRSQRFKGTPLTCEACHRDRHHERRLGPSCALCHNPNGWKSWRFDHDAQTRYPLTGAHRGLDCHACHVTKNVARPTLPTQCVACHRKDDVHQGSFGPSCDRCHTTTSFKAMDRRP